MSMWADYYKETHGTECLETESGFVAFRTFPDFIRIEDFYTAPDKRDGVHTDELFSSVCDIARARGLTKIVARVGVECETRDMSLRAQLKRGFSVIGAAEGNIWLEKRLEVSGG